MHLHDDLPPVASLFGETESRIVVTVAENEADALVEQLVAAQVPYSVLGTVGGERLTICERLDVSLDELRDADIPRSRPQCTAPRRSRPRAPSRGRSPGWVASALVSTSTEEHTIATVAVGVRWAIWALWLLQVVSTPGVRPVPAAM